MRWLGWFVVFPSIAIGASCGLAGAISSGGGGAGATGSETSSRGATGTGGAIGGGSQTSTSRSATATSGTGGAAGSGGGGGKAATSASVGPGPGAGGAGGAGACEPADPGVCCPDDSCAHKCCYTRGGAGLACQTSMCNGAETFQFLCDDSRDCPMMQVCCSHFDGTDYSADFTCMPQAMCPSMAGGAGTHELCDISNPVCRGGGTCTAGTLLGAKHGHCVM